MGINKPNVRWVIHHDLPKNLEAYYQETGRAGRDGLPADCLLLFSAGDAAKQTHFINGMSTPQEQRVARRQLREMLSYSESSACRRHALLAYFGEQSATRCDACDNCLAPRASYDGTTVPKGSPLRLSYPGGEPTEHGNEPPRRCVDRCEHREVRRWNHHTLTTYGIGADVDRKEWAVVGRGLLRQGYLRQSGSEFPVVEITPSGLSALTQDHHADTPDGATQNKASTATHRRDRMRRSPLWSTARGPQTVGRRAWRPAYVIFGDATLREMARRYPQQEALGGIFESGNANFRNLATLFAAEIAAHLQLHPRVEFAARD